MELDGHVHKSFGRNVDRQNCLSLKPNSLDAAWSLLELYEKRNRLADLQARMEFVATLGPTATDTVAHFTALLHFRNKNYAAAKRAAGDVAVSGLEPDKRTSHLWLDAAIADKLGDTQEAFKRFTLMNAAAANAHAYLVTDVPAYLPSQRRLHYINNLEYLSHRTTTNRKGKCETAYFDFAKRTPHHACEWRQCAGSGLCKVF
ncbi:hypothetical protein [Shimia sagamensis]|uniref:hypothetical protein n=1 Tax=Shimia sagamensis TaxID=1566352 RepID=UPI0024B64D8A|nr:hypothetical protein [Shimia sagamensis]